VLYETIRRVRPRNCFEIGTWLGGGTTLVIAKALRRNGSGRLHTIELDEEIFSQAVAGYDRLVPELRQYVEFHRGDYRAILPDVMAHDGMRIAGDGFTLECLATPGHTANHVCYALMEEKALFSGDHVMGWSTSVIAPPDGDMGQYIASLEKLMARDETLFYPTHGSPIPEAKAWVTQLIAHRRQREQQILEGLQDGESSVTQLVLRLYPDIAPALRAAAAQQVMAHLLHLAEKGAVARDGALWRRKI
jgi:glyoxylase-like metal-dependent hydrolase (beta-lactamase superfamily II)